MNAATAAAGNPGRMFIAGDADDEEDGDEEEEYDEEDGEAQEVEEEEVVMDDMVVLNDPQQQHQPSPHVLHPHVTLVLAHPHTSCHVSSYNAASNINAMGVSIISRHKATGEWFVLTAL